MFRPPHRIIAAIAITIFSLWTAGCGGGSGVPSGSLTGSVTDVDGRSVAGATVSVGSRSTVSASNGSFTLKDLSEGFKTVIASATVAGRRWSGETTVDLIGVHQNRSLNIVVSDDRYHGALRGTVIDPYGFAMVGAKVFVGGPFGSTLAVTDQYGNYEALRLTPGVTYTVTASLAGYKNDKRTIHVGTNENAVVSFALANGTNLGEMNGPEGVVAQAWTVSDSVARTASGKNGTIYDWLRQHYRNARGLQGKRAARAIELKSKPSGRVTPTGSMVEIDLFWDYAADEQLFGYAIKRTTSQAALPGADVTAVLRDPLSAAFFDLDPILTPDVPYWYTVHRLDTVSFPASGVIGAASEAVGANPLSPIRGSSPLQGQDVVGTPVLRWNAVNGAAAYQLYVWDEFPAVMFDPNDTGEPNASQPIWPADPNYPGSSLIIAPATQAVYGGPALVPGRTYYWLVVALDSENPESLSALSASQIAKFVKR